MQSIHTASWDVQIEYRINHQHPYPVYISALPAEWTWRTFLDENYLPTDLYEVQLDGTTLDIEAMIGASADEFGIISDLLVTRKYRHSHRSRPWGN